MQSTPARAAEAAYLEADCGPPTPVKTDSDASKIREFLAVRRRACILVLDLGRKWAPRSPAVPPELRDENFGFSAMTGSAPANVSFRSVATARCSKRPPKGCLIWLDSKGAIAGQEYSHGTRFRSEPRFISWRAGVEPARPAGHGRPCSEPWIALWRVSNRPGRAPWPTRGRTTWPQLSRPAVLAAVGVALLPSPTQVWAPVQPGLAGMPCRSACPPMSAT